jgi:hypothetical protein
MNPLREAPHKLTGYEKLIGFGIVLAVPAAFTLLIVFSLSTLMRPDISRLDWWIEMGRRMFLSEQLRGFSAICSFLVLVGVGMI